MPEAAVDEDSHLGGSEDDVCPPAPVGQDRPVDSKPVPTRVKRATNLNLGFCVASSDATHQRALCG